LQFITKLLKNRTCAFDSKRRVHAGSQEKENVPELCNIGAYTSRE